MDTKFIQAFNLFKNDIYRLAYSYTKNKYDADDVSQNVFIKLYNHNEILNNDNLKIKKWLIKVTINECKTLFTSAWKNKITIFKDNEEENIIAKINNSNDILSSIMNLKKKYRIVVYLYYYEGYKINDIAEFLNVSETNVQTRLYRAREQLKISLKEEWYCE